MTRAWSPDPSAGFARRLGKSAAGPGHSDDDNKCPDIWELSNGDIAVIGRDLTAGYAGRLPESVRLGPDERLAVIPGDMLAAAKQDIPDA
ncbi:hypothetical protein [Actinacidiphila acidipaludis]|uniref:Uncharacterized protein n=1 Tax=Actinacidiphila acidipaludis TaxID=2873382 RepID=A0ABS7Q6R8_9ACTN|nr:hypothetical protein [Streptomyces acidipaludis]MBY8877712.1 hypothetical protein [Streptomyces acidipaludis]